MSKLFTYCRDTRKQKNNECLTLKTWIFGLSCLTGDSNSSPFCQPEEWLRTLSNTEWLSCLFDSVVHDHVILPDLDSTSGDTQFWASPGQQREGGQERQEQVEMSNHLNKQLKVSDSRLGIITFSLQWATLIYLNSQQSVSLSRLGKNIFSFF